MFFPYLVCVFVLFLRLLGVGFLAEVLVCAVGREGPVCY